MNTKELLDKAVELQCERTALEKKNKALQAKVKKLEKQLTITYVSGMFSEKQMEQAWTNGCACGESRSGYFDIENYS